MKKVLLAVAVVLAASFFVGCGSSGVQRVSTDTITDLSGRWNDTDAQLVSEAIVDQVVNAKWLKKFVAAKGREPRVIVGTIKNKTDEHIEIDVFLKEIENALTNSGDVKFVASKEAREEMREERTDQQEYSSDDTKKKFKAEKAADFMLQGVLTSIPDEKGGTKAILYQANFELYDQETSEKEWAGQYKQKKIISKAAFGF